jgi:chemotaxis protein MotA
MFIIVGAVVVTASVLGGYAVLGGNLLVLWQPFEAVIICGAAFGAYLIANPRPVLPRTMGAIMVMLKGPKYDKDNYLELLMMMYQIFRLAKTKGMLALKPISKRRTKANCSRNFRRFKAITTWWFSCAITCA